MLCNDPRFRLEQELLAAVLFPVSFGVCIPLVDEHMVGDAVPGVVNAGVEEEQRGGADAEQGLARAGMNRERRYREQRVRRERQKEVK